MADVTRPQPPGLVIFSDDWGRHPSSCQHLARHLAPRHPACWVNTIGMRRPRLDLATLRRAIEKSRQWARGPGPVAATPGGMRVLNPRMWPWWSSPLDRRVNRRLLLGQLRPALAGLPRPVVAVTTIPLVADLVGTLPVDRWAYYCVDDFGQWPGLDQAAIARMEGDLVRRVDVLVAASEVLRDRLARMGREATLLTHGVDLDRWAGDEAETPPPALAGLPRPLVVFWGVIDRRMDASWLECLAGRMAGGTIVLVGPEQDVDPRLASLDRVVRLPPQPFDRLAGLAREAAVLIMPYADLPVTRAMQPLKLKEYLATGRPAVVADLPATRPWVDCLDLVATPESFAGAVLARIATGLPAGQRAARGRLAGESWHAKARDFEAIALGDGIGATNAGRARAASGPRGREV